MRIIFIIFCIFMFCCKAYSATYQIDTVEDYRAIDVQDNDRLEFNGSNTFALQVNLTKSGVTITSYGGGRATFEGTGLNYGVYCVSPFGDTEYSGIIVDNIAFQNQTISGVCIGGFNSFERVPNSTVKNCTVTTVGGRAIQIFGANSKVLDCEIDTWGTVGEVDAGGITMGYATNGEIRRNTCHDSVNGSAIELNWDCSGCHISDNYAYDVTQQLLEVWNNSNDNFVYRNKGERVGAVGIKIQNGSSRNVVKNNIIIDHGTDDTEFNAGIGAFEYEGNCSNDNMFYNNTIYSTQPNGSGGLYAENGCTGNIFKNNIVEVTGEFTANISTGNTLDYNCYYRSSGNLIKYAGLEYIDLLSYTSATGQDSNSIETDPNLQADYSILKTSPAYNTGATLSEVTKDYRGYPRPIGGAYDIGAWEVGYKVELYNCTLKESSI